MSKITNDGLTQCGAGYYAVGHKKRTTLFGIITPMFRGGFLHFLHQWKQETRKLCYSKDDRAMCAI